MTDIRSEVRAFLLTTSMPKTKFGRLAVGDPNFVDRLTRTDLRPATIAKVRLFMESWKPQ